MTQKRVILLPLFGLLLTAQTPLPPTTPIVGTNGGRAGTLPIWTGPNILGNASPSQLSAAVANPNIQINSANYGLVTVPNGIADGSLAFASMNDACVRQGSGSVVVQAGSFSNGAMGPIIENPYCPWTGGGQRVTMIQPSNGTSSTVFQGAVAGYAGGVIVNRSATGNTGSNSYIVSTGVSHMTVFGNGIHATGTTPCIEEYGINLTHEDLEVFGCRANGLEYDYNPMAAEPPSVALAGSHENHVHRLNIHHNGVDVTNNDAVITPWAVGLSIDADADQDVGDILVYNSACHNLFLGHNAAAVIGGDFHLFAPGVGCTNLVEESASNQIHTLAAEGGQGTGAANGRDAGMESFVSGRVCRLFHPVLL